MKKEIDKWFDTFEWGDDGQDLWREANKNGAKVLLDYLLNEADRFVTVDTDTKTGNFYISILWGPMELKIKRSDMEENDPATVEGSTETSHQFHIFAKLSEILWKVKRKRLDILGTQCANYLIIPWTDI